MLNLRQNNTTFGIEPQTCQILINYKMSQSLYKP
jgi:hypothetical protein